MTQFTYKYKSSWSARGDNSDDLNARSEHLGRHLGLPYEVTGESRVVTISKCMDYFNKNNFFIAYQSNTSLLKVFQGALNEI